MARIAGRNGRLMMALTSGGTAETVAFINKTDVDMATAQFDVTSFGDSNMVYVTGLPDFKGTFTGHYDNATSQMYQAAVDGVARRFYWYPDFTNNGQYWFGTAFFSFHVTIDVKGSADISGNIAAATAVSKVG